MGEEGVIKDNRGCELFLRGVQGTEEDRGDEGVIIFKILV